MLVFSLAFLIGVALLQQLAHLPALSSLLIAIPLLFGSFYLKFFYRAIICGVILGFAWAMVFAHFKMAWTLPYNQEGKTISIKGLIYSIPNQAMFGTQFLFKTSKTVLRLTWKNPTKKLYAGDRWQLKVRLKKIHSTQNPGGFDYEANALMEGIRASGYIVNDSENKLLQSHFYHYPLLRIRQWLKEKIEKNLASSNTSPWILALTVGERRNISQENWEVLRNTGTNHLMAIAGLHIGLMAGFVYTFMSWLWMRFAYLTLKIPAQLVGSISALLIAVTYSALAGFSIPTQRACIMLSCFLGITLLKRVTLVWHVYSVALLLVLLINPLTVLSESFWLSFGSIALIIYGMHGRIAPKGLWWKWGRVQWVIAFGLIPFSIWLFQQYSLISFVANSIAIPWVGFVIVPLSLFGTATLLISEKMGGLILLLADTLLQYLWMVLSYFSHLAWASLHVYMLNKWILVTSILGIFLLLLPKCFPARYFGLIQLLPLFLYQPEKPKQNEAWLTLLDVGQGLSAVVQTKRHLLVFDTGSKLGSNLDMGETVLNPFLYTLHAKTIDMLVISHPHNDHEGGASALLNRFPVATIRASAPEKFRKASLCLRGEKWVWDGVIFQFLYPTLENLRLDNDSSCVLKIVAANTSFLLTGDIEKLAEAFLVEKGGLKSQILVAPHHGSKTSAQNDFIKSVSPKYVLYSVGYRNRYRFPHASVIEKYKTFGVKQLDTAKAGAIQFNPEIAFYRESSRKYWHF